jgi:hypothetical protein
MTSPHTTDQWFVRSGGKIKGPFSSAQLEQLQQRGRLHDGHEISSDRSSWRRYSAGMFNAAEPAAPAEEPFYNLGRDLRRHAGLA